MLFAEIPKSKAQFLFRNEQDTGSDLAASKSNYEKLPDYLKSCLDYCCIVSKNKRVKRTELVRLLLAEGLVEEKPGEVMEDTAANILQELFVLGMLQEFYGGNSVRVSKEYQAACLYEVETQEFFDEVKDIPTYVVIKCNGKYLPAIDFKRLSIRSLFVRARNPDLQIDQVFWETICALQLMVVLNLKGKVDYLADAVGELVNLRYLGLCATLIEKLPSSIGNLQKLQTFDISYAPILQLPPEILNIRQLRHLIMRGCDHDGFVIIPERIRDMVNLQSWVGVRYGHGVPTELRNLTQLRELDVQCVSDDYATELSAAIMKMEKLVTLSLRTDFDISRREFNILPQWESFSPPTHLQQLCLQGRLVEIPNWLPSIENLISLKLYNSDLSDNQLAVLQFLPKLKYLTVWDAYKRKLIGKELCDEGGFPMLQTLTICSHDLVEWSDITKGAFPSLRCLRFYNCRKLRFLPEGLQYILTLQKLYFSHLHGDLARRLNGIENYKINHIPDFRICKQG